MAEGSSAASSLVLAGAARPVYLLTMPRVALVELTGQRQEIAALQRVLESAPEYAKRITGLPAGRGDAQSILSLLPEGKDYEDKFTFAVLAKGQMVGCADLIRAYPRQDTVFLGLLLIAESHRRSGTGRRAYEQLESICASWPGILRIRLAVIESNASVMPFWEKVGFRKTGETKPYKNGRVESTSVLLEKRLVQSNFAVVRQALGEDAEVITDIHASAWRSTYTELFPAGVFTDMETNRCDRIARRKTSILAADSCTRVACLASGQRVGFAVGGAERDRDPEFTGELRSIYVLREHQKRKAGTALTRSVARWLIEHDHDSMLVWVLAQNTQARAFYHSLGGKLVREKMFDFAGCSYPKVAYGWTDLRELLG